MYRRVAGNGKRRRPALREGGCRRRTSVGAILLAALGILALAAPVSAFPLTNCTRDASSIKADGSTLDSISAGAADATQADPLPVRFAFGSRGHTITAVIGGVLTGLGATTMLIIYSALPIGEWTPLAMLLIGLAIGLLIGILGRRGGGDKDTAPMLPPSTPPEAPTPA